MNRAERRRLGSTSRRSGRLDCGCDVWGMFVGSTTCPGGHLVEVDDWLPTSLRPGDEAEINVFCEDCLDFVPLTASILEIDHR